MSDSVLPDRLESWKEIAVYLRRDVTTVQRWEKREGMPVHRHVHDKAGSIYAFRTELDAWTQGRKAKPVVEDTARGAQLPRRTLLFVATASVIGAALIFGLLLPRPSSDTRLSTPLSPDQPAGANRRRRSRGTAGSRRSFRIATGECTSG